MATEAQCGSCGESNPSDAMFCLMCGAYLGWHEQGPPDAPRAPDDNTPDDNATEPEEVAPPPRQPRAVPHIQPPHNQPPESQPPESQPPESQPAARRRPVTPGRAEQPPAAAVPPPAVPAPAAAEPTCPACGHRLEPGRRFCGRCGHSLVAAPAGQAVPRPAGSRPRPGWSTRWWGGDPREREARRAYRRSLPARYRWRRGLLGLVAAGLVGAVVWFLAGDPVGRAKAGWADLTGATEPLEEVRAAADPADSFLPGRGPANLVDGKADTAWETPWNTAPRGDVCRSIGGGVRLSWDGTAEVRKVRVRAGLGADANGSARDRQYLPTALGIAYGDRCATVELDSSVGWQTRDVEIDGAVESVVVSVVAADVDRTEPVIEHVALRDVELLARPR